MGAEARLLDFSHAKQLFAACLELVTEFSPKLRQVMLNEMLLLDIHTHEAGMGQSGERPPSDLISRVRGYLEMRLPDIPLHQVIAEECIGFMLNWRENEYLTLQVPAFLLQSNPYVKVTCHVLDGSWDKKLGPLLVCRVRCSLGHAVWRVAWWDGETG
ncbi:PREDICTED: integrator complex subunit 8-like [Galeopterus variegatus]|uniref:Integrator complex subunit 8-like n=1 Tax=Galeopterus variegatus TaxID=482537 RepID=A0ABM0SDX6_GALVR|nr:PREDICTED: integrator complex subunit 8-like [Galeopterus variegatus]